MTTKYIQDLTDEKVQLTNVIRHLASLQKDHPKSTYDVASKLLNDVRDKVSDKLFYANNAQEITNR